MSDIVERKQWFERNKHLFSEGMQQRWLTCAYQDECLIAEIEREHTEIERLRDCLREFDEFAWTAVTADCEEARQNLQRKIDKARAALTASEAEHPADAPRAGERVV